jgi:hypothetical protein
LLETAANERVKLIETQIRLGREAIQKGHDGGPWAFVFPAEQHDPGALYRLLEALHYCGIEVDRATSAFEASGRSFEAGSYVIRMAQPFRAYAKDLLEPQDHPDPSLMPQGKMGEQPYDLTAWSLPLQMGVETIRVEERFDAKLEQLNEIPQPQSHITGSASPAGFLIRPEPNSLSIAANRLLASGARLEILSSGSYAPGSVWAEGIERGYMAKITADLGLHVAGLASKPNGDFSTLQTPRTALYKPWTASIDEGWTRWLLEQYEFPFSSLVNADIRAGSLRDQWDVIILPGDRDGESLIEGNKRASMLAEYRGGLGNEGREALRHFVAKGGTLIVSGDAIDFARKTFELPLRDALEDVPTEEFSAPGSFLRIQIDNTQPLGFGMQPEAIAIFDDDAALEPIPGASLTKLGVVVRYAASDLLASGWLRGEEHLANRVAAAEVRYRKGRIVLIGFRPQFRAQPDNTFKLLFNAIHLAGIAR